MESRGTRLKRTMGDIAFDIVGGGLYALGTSVFNAPGNIAPGGVTGIAILVNYLLGLPIAVVSLAINIPLLGLAFFFLGRRFTLRTMRTVIILTAMLSLTELLPGYQGERILAALAGGVLYGVGLAMVFIRGSTTGGTDIVARLIQKRYPDVGVGRLLLVIDAVVLVSAAFVYRNLESALFAMVGIFTRTQVLDSILYGLDMGKVMMVVSNRYDEIGRGINARLGRGCTLLEAKGSYTLEKRPVVLCVVRRHQYHELKRYVAEVDPGAFLIALDAGEIIGKGFKEPV